MHVQAHSHANRTTLSRCELAFTKKKKKLSSSVSPQIANPENFQTRVSLELLRQKLDCSQLFDCCTPKMGTLAALPLLTNFVSADN